MGLLQHLNEKKHFYDYMVSMKLRMPDMIETHAVFAILTQINTGQLSTSLVNKLYKQAMYEFTPNNTGDPNSQHGVVESSSWNIVVTYIKYHTRYEILKLTCKRLVVFAMIHHSLKGLTCLF